MRRDALACGSLVWQALLLSAEAWAAAASPTVAQQVCLCHLQSLLLALEEGVPGGAAERVHPRYREPLPPPLERALAADARLAASTLLPIVHDFMLAQLGECTWPADAPLKAYLAFSTEVDLETEEWFVHGLPEALELRHTAALYTFLQARGGAD